MLGNQSIDEDWNTVENKIHEVIEKFVPKKRHFKNFHQIVVGVVVQCINHAFAYHAGARRSFPGGDNATPQTAKQTANGGCTIVHLKWCLQVDIPEAQKPRAKTIGSPHNLPHQW